MMMKDNKTTQACECCEWLCDVETMEYHEDGFFCADCIELYKSELQLIRLQCVGKKIILFITVASFVAFIIFAIKEIISIK